MAKGQRGSKRHPGAGFTTFGASPASDGIGLVERTLGIRHSREKELCVGMAWRSQQLLGRTHLDDVTGVHDDDPVGDVAGGGEVVGDVQDRHALTGTQVGHHVEDTDPDRDVEHGNRLIGEDQLRAQSESLGESDPLSLTAAQLVGVLGKHGGRGREADGFHHPQRLLAAR